MIDNDLPREVDALHDDGHWYRGWLEHVWRRDDGWHGMVRYTVAPGFAYGRVMPARQLRRPAADARRSDPAWTPPHLATWPGF